MGPYSPIHHYLKNPSADMPRTLLLLLCCATVPASFLLSGCVEPTQALTRPTRAVIEQHLAPGVTVYGSYAVVKLPINDGVTIWNPTQIVRGPDGVMYAANHTGEIYSLHDTDGDTLEDTARLFCNVTDDGLRAPAGLAFQGRDLYVGTAQEVRIYTDRDGDGRADTSRTFFDEIPHSEHPYEWTSALTFGPDGYLYLVLTTDSWNAGASPDPKGWRGALLRISPDGRQVERFAIGLRSVHGMAFNAQGDLFFADNEGGGNPTEELNLARRGSFYGHNPEKYGHPSVTEPLLVLRTEVAPAGLTFNPPDNDFDGTAGDLFIAFYGPGERWRRGAIGRVRLTRRADGHYQAEEAPVASGLAKISDVAFGDQGDLYVAQVGQSTYWYQPLDAPDGAFYRLIYAPWIEAAPAQRTTAPEPTLSGEDLERGRQRFADLACSACHAVDGKTQLLGPNLKYIGQIYTRDELLEEIQYPSRRIKPSMAATRLVKQNGDVLLGRVVGSDEHAVRLMIVSNRVISVPRAEIVQEEAVLESLMFEGLLANQQPEDIDALLSYLMSLQDR